MHNSQKEKNEIQKSDLEKILLVEKKSLREAAKIFSVSHKIIYGLAKKFEIEIKSQVAKNRVEEIFEMYCNGVPCKKIAERIGCSKRRVEQIVQKCMDAQRESNDPEEVAPYRCPTHGLVRFRPCIACMAEGTISHPGA